jgi:phage tail sheath gpL-like
MLANLLNLNFLVPFVAHKIDWSRSIRGLRGMPRRVLLIGHKLAAGNAQANTVVEVSTDADALAACGEGSQLLAMWRAAKANAGLGLPIDIIAVPTNGTGTSATSTIVVANAGATVQYNGEVMLYVEGKRISIGVNTADTAATVATKLIAAINAETSLPVTAAATATASEVRLTARWVGPSGNLIDVRSTHYTDDVLPAGLTLTIPAMAGGAGNPDLSAAIAAMNGYRATEIACAFTDSANMTALETELETRWGHNNMQDGQAVVALRDTEANIKSWLAGRNSRQVHTIATTADMTSPWVTAAMAAAAIETSAVSDPALPYTDIVLQGYKGPRRGAHWSIDQQAALLLEGGSPLAINQDGTGALLRVVTNYTKSAAGVDDASTRELAWVKTMSYYRWFTVTEYATKYRGYKLAEYITEAIPGQKIMTRELVEEIQIGIYVELSKVALVQNLEHYKDSLVVELDGPNGKVKVQDEPVLVTQHYQTEVTSYPIAGRV